MIEGTMQMKLKPNLLLKQLTIQLTQRLMRSVQFMKFKKLQEQQ